MRCYKGDLIDIYEGACNGSKEDINYIFMLMNEDINNNEI